MSDNGRAPYRVTGGPSATRRRTLRSYRECAPESDLSDSEPAANTPVSPSPLESRDDINSNVTLHSLPGAGNSQQLSQSSVASPAAGPAPTTTTLNPAAASFTPLGGTRRTRFMRTNHRGGRDSATGSPSPADFVSHLSLPADTGTSDRYIYQDNLGVALDHDTLDELVAQARAEDAIAANTLLDPWRSMHAENSSSPSASTRRSYSIRELDTVRSVLNRAVSSGSSKRSRDRFEGTDGNMAPRTLTDRGAVAIMQYRNAKPDPDANDIWPEFRSAAKLPAQYSLLDKDKSLPEASRTKRRSPNIGKKRVSKDKQPDILGRPKWDLPVELVEIIASYLDRDDIKSLRMVSRELNYFVSQVIFQTVVVPFNTEIYGMLAQGQKPDLKGKKRARREKPGYSWRNANGDEVYNGHGLDVFKGFGQHILQYGMSFEVNEESLSQPPIKSLTESKTSFWGNYDWPYEEYRRFDAVAGLETAADETPRMTLAFSELTRVKELALSVDSGLGWLNGPDRSIRARILRRSPSVFGTSKDVPDRRAQAQQELWRYIQARHQLAGDDIKLATLYRLDGARPLAEVDEARMLAEEQPAMPYLDAQLIHEAIPHDAADVSLPASFDEPEMLDRFVLEPSAFRTGVLFSSTSPPTDAAQVMSPVIPACLTKAQKEWLLETEWAQRAFMSSYMLSIIDNPTTFTPVHTLNISRLSDRYLVMLNRPDFWSALPNLKSLTLMVIPGWRNVYKDEAGFVDAPRINPVNGLDTFLDLMSNHVATRPNIKDLKIGWVGGGERAEGLHARNKLLMPAPLMPMAFANSSFTLYEMIAETDADHLRAALLRFPHVERLVLENCWITPATLLQFVKIHDAMNLKHLVLDSVSATAVLRPQGNGNANQAAQPLAALLMQALPAPLPGIGGAANAWNNNTGLQGAANQAQPQHPQPTNAQVLNWLVQSLTAQTQIIQNLQQAQGNGQQIAAFATLSAQVQAHLQRVNQLQHHQQLLNLAQNQQQAFNQHQVAGPAQGQQQGQNLTSSYQQVLSQQNQALSQTQISVAGIGAQLQVLQQHLLAPVPPPPLQPYQPPANPQSLLQAEPREGSWTWLIDQISPGTNLTDFNSTHSRADPARTSSLQTIQFTSCGYAKLPHANFDQAAIDHGNRFAASTMNPLLMRRHNALCPAMMAAKWAHLGEIVQDNEASEFVVLEAAWDLREGAGWEDEEAEAVEFDGCARGGTGRFSGCVRRADRVKVDEV
ncbi:hypothetical protein HBI38_026710 [Parastagonospora nodorum]|nr:hypothetical protein HBI10_184090 [Parastagonospora nodorum]KAH4014104.1 hypothetical protein HBI13_176190 [Parastagonospora nodorum]KAH4913571.1 hypothetical protein HBH74_161470 [Parastagonospora nodorum]KAH4973132.1 hypothetical protein HBI78_017130 [Parastagonospora nodorum]KAH4991322.1 hypothetical protein HBH73_021390 [Parastagonospora nodorum]